MAKEAAKKPRAKKVAVHQPTFTRAWKHYGLRTCQADGESRNGFIWPETGMVECPDWKPEASFENGLHALLNGEGEAGLLSVSDRCRWQAVGFDEYVDLGGKVKFPRCEVVTGTREQITSLLKALTGGAVHYGIATAGHYGIATVGDYGIATVGDCGIATAGRYGIIQIRHWDEKANRYRLATAYVGENGIKAGVAYKLDASGQFVECGK